MREEEEDFNIGLLKVLYKENHYMSEMQFLPRPGELMALTDPG